MKIPTFPCFHYRLPDLKRTLIALCIQDNVSDGFEEPNHLDFATIIRTVGIIAFIAAAIGVAYLMVAYYYVGINRV